MIQAMWWNAEITKEVQGIQFDLVSNQFHKEQNGLQASLFVNSCGTFVCTACQWYNSHQIPCEHFFACMASSSVGIPFHANHVHPRWFILANPNPETRLVICHIMTYYCHLTTTYCYLPTMFCHKCTIYYHCITIYYRITTKRICYEEL